MKISFIGAGSMAEAIISGLIANEICDAGDIYITNRSNQAKMQNMKQRYGVKTTYDMAELLEDADLVVFAVKPKDAGEALRAFESYLTKNTLFISVMAGISIPFLEERITARCPIARAMPNTSAAVGKSATALAFNNQVTEKQAQLAQTVFSAIGMTTIVEENQLDAITGLSGSGPAYVYYLVEAMEQSAQDLGLDEETAKGLIIQTLYGAAEMLSQSDKQPAQLRKEITSPGGTTEAGIAVLDENGVKETFIACIKAAAEQSKKLGTALNV